MKTDYYNEEGSMYYHNELYISHVCAGSHVVFHANLTNKIQVCTSLRRFVYVHVYMYTYVIMKTIN